MYKQKVSKKWKKDSMADSVLKQSTIICREAMKLVNTLDNHCAFKHGKTALYSNLVTTIYKHLTRRKIKLKKKTRM